VLADLVEQGEGVDLACGDSGRSRRAGTGEMSGEDEVGGRGAPAM
jgi:hypothetical protein